LQIALCRAAVRCNAVRETSDNARRARVLACLITNNCYARHTFAISDILLGSVNIEQGLANVADHIEHEPTSSLGEVHKRYDLPPHRSIRSAIAFDQRSRVIRSGYRFANHLVFNEGHDIPEVLARNSICAGHSHALFPVAANTRRLPTY